MPRRNLILALYFLVAVVILALINVPEALLFLSLLTYLIMIKCRYVDVLSFAAALFLIALPHKLLSIILSIIVVTLPYVVLNLKLIYERWLCLIPIACVILLRAKLGWLIIPLAIAYYVLKGDSRLFTGSAIVLLIATAYLLTILPEAYANTIATYAYYMLVLGVLGALLEYLREKDSGDESEDKAVQNQ